MLPCAPAITTREMIEALASRLGHTARIQRIPPLVMSVLGLAIPMMRELREMAYQWEEVFVVDDGRFRSRFGVEATPLAAGILETADWARRTFAGAPAT